MLESCFIIHVRYQESRRKLVRFFKPPGQIRNGKARSPWSSLIRQFLNVDVLQLFGFVTTVDWTRDVMEFW